MGEQMTPWDSSDHVTCTLAPPTLVEDDWHLAFPAGASTCPPALARSLLALTIVTQRGEFTLRPVHLSWSWSSGDHADSDRLTVLVADDSHLPYLPPPCHENWNDTARAIYVLDHHGFPAARWARRDLRITDGHSLSIWDEGERDEMRYWSILDAAVEQGTRIEWVDGTLRTPVLEAPKSKLA